MHFLLLLHFNLSIAMLPYVTIEECEKEAIYYRQHYGEELTKAECLPIDEELLEHE